MNRKSSVISFENWVSIFFLAFRKKISRIKVFPKIKDEELNEKVFSFFSLLLWSFRFRLYPSGSEQNDSLTAPAPRAQLHPHQDPSQRKWRETFRIPPKKRINFSTSSFSNYKLMFTSNEKPVKSNLILANMYDANFHPPRLLNGIAIMLKVRKKDATRRL